MTIKGSFQITDWQESIVQQLGNNSKLSKACVQQNYQGFFEGSSEANYLLCYNQDGNAFFNGFEILTTKVNDKPCQLVLKHEGRFLHGIASSTFVILQSIPDNDLVGKEGSFESGEAGQAFYRLI